MQVIYTKGPSKMVWNMVWELKTMEMEIIIKVNTSMGCQKVSANMSGVMAVTTKVTSNKD